MEPTIKTQLDTNQINGKRICYTSLDGSILNVEAMLESWPKPDGTMSVTVVAPYDMSQLNTVPQKVTQYGVLTQEEFDSYIQQPGN